MKNSMPDKFNSVANKYHIIDTMIRLLLSRSTSFELANRVIDAFMEATIPFSHEIDKHMKSIIYETENTENTINDMESN